MYTIRIEKRCLRELKKVDKQIIMKVFDLIETIVAKDPYSGRELKGKYKGLYSYRFADYRIIYQINDDEIEILILRIRHRKDVYDGI
ncbi:MAG: type II toxin-antitoxin system RelE/ParE family toxin [Spirochaetales bacterium]|nr:type II toxin-antitoxin system RelE/ParE family toxin [Spirochaetales bacterium]